MIGKRATLASAAGVLVAVVLSGCIQVVVPQDTATEVAEVQDVPRATEPEYSASDSEACNGLEDEAKGALSALVSDQSKAARFDALKGLLGVLLRRSGQAENLNLTVPFNVAVSATASAVDEVNNTGGLTAMSAADLQSSLQSLSNACKKVL